MSSLPRNPRPRGMSTQRRALMLAIACVLSVLAFQVVDRGRLTVNDFLEYWTAARLDLAGQDPYSPTAMYELEKQTGLHSEKPLMMWNPPWVLPFVVPLGLMSLGKARTLVLLLTLVIVFGCADWLWRFYGGAAQRRWVAWGLACTFAPAMVCITSGQIAPVVLLGVVLFLWLEQRSLHFAAGAAMLLIAFKPHLLYLFWLVAALWIVRNRRWPLAAGALAAIAAATAVAVLISKDLLLHYWRGGALRHLHYMRRRLVDCCGWRLAGAGIGCSSCPRCPVWPGVSGGSANVQMSSGDAICRCCSWSQFALRPMDGFSIR